MRAYRPIADRRQQLVEAGLKIAERDGVAAVTVRRIAAEAGVSLGLVSYCFGSKAELTLAMAARIAKDLTEHSDPESGAAGSARATGEVVGINAVLRTAIEALWAQVERTPRRQLLTYEITTMSLREPGMEDVAQRQYETTVALVSEVLDHAGRAAGVTWTRDLESVANLVVMAVDGATLRWLVDHDSEAALARLGDIADLISTMTTAQ
jgi:AcrR family transcriptional regulator